MRKEGALTGYLGGHGHQATNPARSNPHRMFLKLDELKETALQWNKSHFKFDNIYKLVKTMLDDDRWKTLADPDKVTLAAVIDKLEMWLKSLGFD